MTTITVYCRSNGDVTGFRAEGHTGFGNGRGGDIVCSAVSVLTQTAVNALEAVAGVPTAPVVCDGLLEIILAGGLSAKQAGDCQIILRTVVQGLNDVAQSYPGKVRVVYKEWRKTNA